MTCPDLDQLVGPHDAKVTAHLAECEACRIVADLADERALAIDDRAACARFEDLLAVRGGLETAVAEELDAHLASCVACRSIANTMAPVDVVRMAVLPTVSTTLYSFGREVARGGMGRVVAAHDLRIGRPVAVKELLGSSPTTAARFEREARITARLQHPGIVPIYEIGVWPDGTPFYAMRMVEGRTLSAAFGDAENRLALLPSVIAAAEAVAFAHAHDVIHRDLKPSNIMVGAFGETVVIDWGLAKELDEPDGELVPEIAPYRALPNSTELTSAGEVMGTAAYMPPEQASGGVVDQRADVYALGAILYHLLAGAAPYAGMTSVEIVEKVKSEAPPPLPATAPRDLASIVAKAMARSPVDRYPSARELAEELQRFQTGRIVEAHAYSRGELVRRWLRRNRGLVIGAAAALVALVIAGSIGFAGVLRERDIATAHEEKEHAIATALLEEQGRQELLAGHVEQSLAYLNAALAQGLDTPALRFMLAAGLRELGGRRQLYACDVPIGDLAVDAVHVIAACGERVLVWNQTGALVATLSVPRAKFVRSSHDARLILTAGDELRVWDATTGATRGVLEKSARLLTSPMFTADDQRAVALDHQGILRVWEISTGAVVKQLALGSPPMNATFSNDGRFVAVTRQDRHATIWDVASGAAVEVDHGARVQFARLSDDGMLVVTCGLGGVARIWDSGTGKKLAEVTAHTNAFDACEFSPDGRLLLLAAEDGAVDVWNARSATKVASISYGGSSDSAGFNRDGHQIWIATARSLELFSTDTGIHLAHYATPSQGATFSLDGTTILTINGSQIEGWDTRRRQISFAPDIGDTPIDLNAGETRLLTIRDDGTVKLWNVQTGALIPQLDLAVHALDLSKDDFPSWFSADGKRLTGRTRTGQVVVADALTGLVVRTLEVAHPPTLLALDREGRRLLVVGDGSPRVWDVERGVPILTLGGRTDASSLSDDGRRVLAWSDPQIVELWDVDNARQIARIPVVGAISTTALGFDRDDRTVAIEDQLGDFSVGRLTLWDAKTGAPILSTSATFASLDSERMLLSIYTNGRAEVWRLSDRQRISSAQLERVDTGHYNPTPVVSADGLFLVTNGSLLDSMVESEIRSAVDGRVLARMGRMQETAWPTLRGGFTITSWYSRWIGVHDVVLFNRGLDVVPIPIERRSASEIDREITTRVPWRVEDGRLVPIMSRLGGRVLRAGLPAAGVTVTAKLAPFDKPVSVTTAADGTYLLEGIADGEYRLDAAGGPVRRVAVRFDAPATVDLSTP